MANNFGVVLFDKGDPQNGSTHYACQTGKPAFPFSSVSELSSQVLWVSNASFDTLAGYGLNRNPKLAQDGYFRTRINQIVQELGLQDMEPVRQVSLLASILGSAATLVQKQLGMVHYPTSSIAQGVGQLYGTAEMHETHDLYQIAERASQRFTSSERTRRMQNAEVFAFWKPRYSYAQQMLTCRLPQEHLSQVPPQHLPGGGADPQEVVRWAIEADQPVFAQIEIRSLDESVGRLMNYGAGAADLQGDYQARNMREWCALPELMVLVQSGDVMIKRVLVSSGWKDHGLRTLNSPSAGVSYAYGLVAENLWCGLMRQPSRFGRISKTLATAWLQAYDRMQMLEVAERLSQVGFEVLNFGNGRITVACPPSLRHLIPSTALEHDLMYPASLEGLGMYPVANNNYAHIQQNLISAKDFGNIVTVDNHLLREV